MKPKQPLLTLYKNKGETPLECLERFKIENPEYKNEKMTYAGRLDPLAEGLLLVLTGEECKNKEKYLGLDKEYEVDVLFGFSTDTYDLLGKVQEIGSIFWSSQEDQNIEQIVKSFVGKFSQKYPAFSSKTIKGESMFNLARSRELGDEEIPEKEVEIKSIKLLKQYTISCEDLEEYIKSSIDLVNGDFRQEEIYKEWQLTLDSIIPVQTGIHNLDPSFRGDDKSTCRFSVISIRVNCTSGTYMRTLANEIGKKVGIPALAFSIKRTRIGDYLV